MDEVSALAEILSNPLAALALVLITGLRGDWVFGWLYREQQTLANGWKDEAEKWQKLALDEHNNNKPSNSLDTQ